MATTSGTASPGRGVVDLICRSASGTGSAAFTGAHALRLMTRGIYAMLTTSRRGAGGWGLAFGVVVLLLLSPVLVWGEVYAFRDTFHFYYPLWSWVDGLPWADRWWPQWNPFDRHGVAVDAEPTTLVFYPLRCLLHLPFVDVGRGIGLLLIVHLALGYGGVYCVARGHGLTRGARHWAAAGYMLSGPIFFQVYNPIYLIGAAWVPWSWWSMMRCLDGSGRERWCGMLGLGVVWGMMILGGDPQGVVHGGMIYGVLGLGWILGGWWGAKSETRFGDVAIGGRWRHWLVGGVGAAVIGLLLSMVQVIPTVWRVMSSTRGVERGEVMEYSIAPWHWVTCGMPMGMGSFLPEHGRWSEAIVGEPRMWVPSLHFGVLLMLGLGWAYGGLGRKRRGWLVVMTLIGILGAMGPWGGLQGWLVAWVPGYAWFRYPAKWLPYAMLGLSVLGAMGMRHRLRAAEGVGGFVRAWWVGMAMSVGVMGLWIGLWVGPSGEWFASMCRGVEADPILGRLEVGEARGWIGVGCLTAVLGGWMCLMVGRIPLGWRLRVIGLWILVELGGLAWWQTVTIPSEVVRAGIKGEKTSWVASNGMEALAYGQAVARFGKLHLLVPEGNGEAMLTLKTEVDSLGAGTSRLVTAEYPMVAWSGAGWRVAGKWASLTRLELEVEANESVALETQMAGLGWKLVGGDGEVEWRMERGLGVLVVEAGHHDVVLEYGGRERVWGGWISLVSWVLVVGGGLWNCRRKEVSGKL